MENLVERNRLIQRYIPLAKKLARKKYKTFPRVDVDEFISAAFMGLVDAASRYEEEKGEFGSYAKLRINGEIQDYLRSLGFGSKGSVSGRCTQFSSLDACVQDEKPIALSLETSGCWDLKIIFEEMIEGLDEEGQDIFRLRFYEERSLGEIGQKMGVSESRISQRITQYRRQLAASAA